MIKKLFSLAAAVLVCAGVWAALPTLPTSTLTLPNFPESGWKGVMLPSVIDTTNNWYIVSPYEIYQSAFSWSNTAGGGSSNATGTIWATKGVFPSNTRYSTTDKDSKYYYATLKEFDSKKHYYGYRVTNCEAVALIGASGSNKKRTIYLAAYEITNNTLPDSANATKTASFESSDLTQIMIEDLDATKEYYIYVTQKGTGTGGSSSGNSSFYSIAFKSAPQCSAPTTALSLSSDANETVYVGDIINLSTTGGNGAGISVVGTAEETLGGYAGLTWTATVGEHTFVATQVAYNGYCAQESELVFNVLEKNPVTAVSVAGETSTYVGDILTYTATAANATAYEWYINDEKQGSDSAKLIVTAAVKGAYSIVCKARNEFNAENEWIASEAVNLTVAKGGGVLISYIVNSDANGATSKSGIFSENATPKVSLTKGTSSKLTVDEIEYTGFKMDKGKYVGVTLSKGSFIIGDTVSFMITSATGSAKLYLYNDEQGTTRLDSIEGVGVTGWATFILNQPTKGVYLYRSNPDVKPYDQNPHVAAMKVIRPKDVKSVAEALTAVSINANAISAAQMTSLLADESLAIEDDYLNAPTIVFTKTITTTYDDDSQSAKNVEIEVEAEEVTGKWQAQAEINEVTYTVTTAKTASYTVTYKCGEETLGTELVISNGHPTDYAKYESLALSTFNSWYSDATLETAVADMSAEVISSATTYYADITYKYATSVNIEQWILNNGAGKGSTTKTTALLNEMETKNFLTNIAWSSTSKEENELDSLDDSKGAQRNYAYLGLKVKQAGKLINFRVAKGKTVKVKFGNLGVTPKVAINDLDSYTDMSITNGVYTYTATGEDLISIYINVAQKAVIFKQIVIGDAPAFDDVVYAINCATATNGSVSCAWGIAVPGETVNLTVTPNSGYKIVSVSVNEVSIEVVNSKYSFTMPAAAANVSAIFDTATAISNTDAAVQTVKVIRNGQLIIIRDGKEFNVLGAAVK